MKSNQCIILSIAISLLAVLGAQCGSVNNNGVDGSEAAKDEVQEAEHAVEGGTEQPEDTEQQAEQSTDAEVPEEGPQEQVPSGDVLAEAATDPQAATAVQAAPSTPEDTAIEASAGPPPGQNAEPETAPAAEPKDATPTNSGCGCGKNKTTNTNTQTEPEEERDLYTATLQIVTPTGTKMYTAEVITGSSVEQLMQKARSNGLAYQVKSFGGMGSYVESINGLAEDPQAGMYWMYYVNGVKSTTGISTRTLSSGDTVKWNYERAY